MRLLGQILLWGGFLTGSLLTVLNAPKEGVRYTKGLHPKVLQLEVKKLLAEMAMDEASLEARIAKQEEDESASENLARLESGLARIRAGKDISELNLKALQWRVKIADQEEILSDENVEEDKPELLDEARNQLAKLKLELVEIEKDRSAKEGELTAIGFDQSLFEELALEREEKPKLEIDQSSLMAKIAEQEELLPDSEDSDSVENGKAARELDVLKSDLARMKARKDLKKVDSELKSLGQLDSILDSKGGGLENLTEIASPKNGWHLIPWVPYGVAALVCFAGVVLLHVSKANATQKPEDTAASLSEIKSALASAIEKASALSQESGKMAPSKIVARIDDEIAEYLRVFADGRDCMTTEYGLNVFADVMSPFAAGERAINRAWSASADGYIDEATDCLKRGCDMLIAAQTELENAGKR